MSSGSRAYNTRPSNAITRPGQIQIDADREGRRPRRPSAQVQQEREERAFAHEAALAERDAGAKHLAMLQAKQAKEREASTAAASKPLSRKELAALKKAAGTASSKTTSQVRTKAAGAASGQTQDDQAESSQADVKPRTQRGRVSTKLTRAHVDAVHAAANADVDDAFVEFEVTKANVKEALEKAGMTVAESPSERQSQKQKAADVAAVGSGRKRKAGSLEATTPSSSQASNADGSKKQKPLRPSGFLTPYLRRSSESPAPLFHTDVRRFGKPQPPPMQELEPRQPSISNIPTASNSQQQGAHFDETQTVNDETGYVPSDEDEVKPSTVTTPAMRKTDQGTVIIIEDDDDSGPWTVSKPKPTPRRRAAQPLKPRGIKVLGFSDAQEEVVKTDITNRLRERLGTLRLPWDITHYEASNLFIEVFDKFLPGIQETDLTFKPNTAEHAFMMQKVYDFRHKFAEIGTQVVEEYLTNEENGFEHAEDRAAEAQRQIGPGLPFLSLKTIVKPGRNNKDIIKRAGIYQGECLIMALARYYKHIGVCPGDAFDYPCGALGLCAVALERAFRLWLRGTYNEQAAATPMFNFKSSNYVNATRDYAASIDNISDQKWEEILDLTSAVWSSEHSQEDIELGEVRAGIISDAEDDEPNGDKVN